MNNTTPPKPLVLLILDGWGYSQDPKHNPTKTVPTPTIDALFKKYPHTFLAASGKAVGLPEGQMGNSEVGHLHIGAGRKLPQDLVRINQAIQSNTFDNNPAFLEAIAKAKQHNSNIHILGLLSPGGVHSHEQQLFALVKLLGKHGIKKQYTHAILDGRDTPPQSAEASLQRLTHLYNTLPGGKIASVIGRYYAMDRDKRWDRTQKAYDLLTLGTCDYTAKDALAALQMAYQRNETDEFIKPTVIGTEAITVNDNDVIIFMNYRSDRARQLTYAFIDASFEGFTRHKKPTLSAYITLTQYFDSKTIEVAYPTLPIKNTLGEYIASLGLSQLRLAETEKYAHVTYFLNGGIETPFPKEDRKLIPSPNVATYDLQPEMSANELTDALVQAIQSQQYDLIICNYANPDMIGHTGNEKAAEQTMHVMDLCLKRVLSAITSVNGEICLTADHGNIEIMFDEQHQQPHTAHTTNLVPFIYVGKPAKVTCQTGALDDVAPTLLYLLGQTPPKEMTGKVLLQYE